ncbi:MAG: sensor domain-containing phosphodiesterase [Lysobacteraceae bacterium]|nr:MAG: sensor domain-containing phosphodiesterase [Xanthomonadaceae bacterium]
MAMSAVNGEAVERSTRARRHNHALVALGRQIWHADCSLGTAIALICEAAAETLGVERVNVWRVDAEELQLRCIHAYVRSADEHDPPGFKERLPLDSQYGSQLDDVRVIDVGDVATDSTVSPAEAALGQYLHRHGIHSLLDAPVRSEGRLLGVVCHEHVGEPRVWSPEDHAFAGSIGDYVAIAFQIARRRKMENRLRFIERHDPHTNLPNRDHLLEVAHSALRPMHEGDTGLVVIHLRVDMPPGDATADIEAFHRFLIDGADRLHAMLAGQVVLARVREDALAVIPHRHLQEVDALELAERCIDALESVRKDDDDPAVVTAGIAFSCDLAAPSADVLLRNAENASARARSHAFSRCKVFNADRHRGLLARMRTEQALREAFANGQLLLHFMPEVDLRNGRWRSAEALLRWRDEEGRIVPAVEFIEAAEASGLIVRIGRWVLLEACAAAQRWPAVDGGAPLLRVNVSARQFEDAGLLADVIAALSETGLPAERLCLELTETLLLRDPTTTARTLARLRALGVKVALDDFGTGYCSLNYLKQLPIDTIKIDRGFTIGLPHDRSDLAIVRSLVYLAGNFGLEVIGEGVEQQAQADCLRGFGVDAAQGYFYSRPIDNQAFIARLGQP